MRTLIRYAAVALCLWLCLVSMRGAFLHKNSTVFFDSSKPCPLPAAWVEGDTCMVSGVEVQFAPQPGYDAVLTKRGGRLYVQPGTIASVAFPVADNNTDKVWWRFLLGTAFGLVALYLLAVHDLLRVALKSGGERRAA